RPPRPRSSRSWRRRRTRTRARSRRDLVGRLGTFFERRRRQHGVLPFLQPLLLMGQLVDVVLRVVELAAPEERVERTGLDADTAVHAERVIDREPIEDLGGAGATASRGLVGLLVGVDVDAPVGTFARALVAN